MTDTRDLAYVRTDEEPILPPPRGRQNRALVLVSSLFSSLGNAILTLAALVIIILVVPPIIRWAFIDAVWTGDSRDACLSPDAGACWAFVKAKFPQFMYGRYPLDERWRVDLTAILLIIGLVPMAIPRVPFKRENAIYLLGVFPLIALILLTGGNLDVGSGLFRLVFFLGCFAVGISALFIASGGTGEPVRLLAGTAGALGVPALIVSAALGEQGAVLFGLSLPEITIYVIAIVALVAGTFAIEMGAGRRGLRRLMPLAITLAVAVALLIILGADFGLRWVETPLWGGLLVTLVVAIVGIVGSMPLGVVLALGRRSRLPIVRFASIAFIEFVRGVPLITVLFMASVMLPLFLPAGVNFDKLLRALVGVTLFSAAYVAEVVRGGLQAIPRGQYEAASALGLGYGASMRLIILPQALKIVIPGLVNSFIALFKDTSLVLIIGIFDLLGIVQLNFTDPNWASPNTPATGYVFAALVFWLFCFGMSRYSIYTERRLDTGYRR
jgi:general L-amino acid transport system permease protein